MIFGNRLFFKGCTINFVLKDIGENYRKILRKLDIDFIEIEELCCGYPLLNAGEIEVYKKHVERLRNLFKEYAIKEIISPCPTCVQNFRKNGMKAFHVTEVLYSKIKKLKKFVKKLDLSLAYHDPCHLGRYQGIYEEPREILKLCINLVEFDFNREFSFCCGGGGGLRTNFPSLSKKIAKERVDQAKKVGAEGIVTCCPMCYINLKENSDIPVYELSQVLLMAMGEE